MATYTPNYNLIKPDVTDLVDVGDLNDNSDIIDTTLAAKANLVGGKVPASELPSYVDDVIEGYYYNGAFYSDSGHTTPITAETGKIYIDLDTESCYRWSGSVYVKISSASDALYVEFTESSGVYSCDTGLQDMFDALDEGREVIGVYDNGGVQEKYYVGNYSETGDYVTFYSYNSTGKIAELFGTGSGSEMWTYDEFSLTGGGGQLPTATNLGDIPSWNPGTQLWEITHKGSIAQSNQGWVTGGDIYTVVGNIEAALIALIGGES